MRQFVSQSGITVGRKPFVALLGRTRIIAYLPHRQKSQARGDYGRMGPFVGFGGPSLRRTKVNGCWGAGSAAAMKGGITWGAWVGNTVAGG